MSSSKAIQWETIKERLKPIIDNLEAMGLQKFSMSEMGGGRKLASAVAIVNRCAQFIYHVYFLDCWEDLELLTIVKQWEIMVQLITERYSYLASFTQWLSTVKGHQPSTIVNYINDILMMANWLVLFFRPEASLLSQGPTWRPHRRLEQSSLTGIYAVSAALKRSLNKSDKHLRATERLSEPNLVAMRKCPEGGLPELVNVVGTRYSTWFIPLWNAWKEGRKEGLDSKGLFGSVFKLLIALGKKFILL